MEHLYKIVNKLGQSVLFSFNREQSEIYDTCFNGQGEMVYNPNVLKSRQIGITTMFVLCYLDDVIWTPNINAYIQSHEQDSIERIFRIARYAYSCMPDELRPELAKGGGSKYEMYFPRHNSRIYVGLENRSSAIHRLHLSEVAFQDKERIAATMGALPKHICYSRETTPNGMNWYHDEWLADHLSVERKFFFPWFYHIDNQIKTLDVKNLTDEEADLASRYKLRKSQIEFRRMKIHQLGRRLFFQEFPEDDKTCFLTSGQIVLSSDALSRLSAVDPIRVVGDIKIYREFEKSEIYVCAADTAEGLGSDYSVATMFDSKRRQCAVLRAKLRPSDFAHAIDKMCAMYSREASLPPLLAVERNNHGHAVLLELEEHIRYHNLYYTTPERSGWITDRVTRPIMISAFIDAIENQTIEIGDKDTINECLTLVENNGKIEAAAGHHDDCIISVAIAIQLLAHVARQSASGDPEKDYLI